MQRNYVTYRIPCSHKKEISQYNCNRHFKLEKSAHIQIMFHLFGKKNNLKFQCFTQRTRPQYRNQSCPGSDYCLMRVMQTPVITSLVSSVSDAWHKHKMPFMCRHENVINAKKLRNKGNCQLTDGQITEINDVNCIHFFLICVINSFPLTRRIQFCDPLNKNVIIHYI